MSERKDMTYRHNHIGTTSLGSAAPRKVLIGFIQGSTRFRVLMQAPALQPHTASTHGQGVIRESVRKCRFFPFCAPRNFS